MVGGTGTIGAFEERIAAGMTVEVVLGSAGDGTSGG